MTRRSLLPATFLSVVLTGVILTRAGWFAATSLKVFPHRGDGHSHARAHDVFYSDAAYRWRHCQPTHWRACLIQP